MRNFPVRPVAWLLRALVFPLGRREVPPSDRLGHRVAAILMAPNEARTRLTSGAYLTPSANNPVGRMNALLPEVIAAEPVERKFLKAVKSGDLGGSTTTRRSPRPKPRACISGAERKLLERVRAASFEFISVDDFDAGGIARGDEEESSRSRCAAWPDCMAAAALQMFRKLGGSAPGRWLFSRIICWKAPYFASISPRIEALEPGRCVVRLRQRRAHPEPYRHRARDRHVQCRRTGRRHGHRGNDPGFDALDSERHERALSEKGARRIACDGARAGIVDHDSTARRTCMRIVEVRNQRRRNRLRRRHHDVGDRRAD